MKSTSPPNHRQTKLVTTVPKLLHWYAARAGLSMQTAEALWQRACRNAALTNEIGSGKYFRDAIETLNRLIEAESMRRDLASLGTRPWLRYQARLVTVGLANYLACVHQTQARLTNTLFLLHPAGYPAVSSRRFK